MNAAGNNTDRPNLYPASPQNDEGTPIATSGLGKRARVLYQYDAADSKELALQADEVITVYNVPGLTPDWMMGERGLQKGKVPVAYLEILN